MTTRARFLGVLGGLATAVAACYSGPHVDDPGAPTSTQATEPTEAEDTSDDGAGAGATPVCSSAKTWTGGDRKSKLMHPGVACIACHAKKRGAPRYAFAGTVFPSLHEEDDCYGVAGGVQVVVTDAKGVVASAAVNAAGNFFFSGSLTPPLAAKVVAGGREVAMKEPVTTGDCNGCHTSKGSENAKGRITSP